MISSDVYLTAAHCMGDWPEGTRFYVSLDQTPWANQLSELGSRQLATAPWLVVGYGTEEATVPGPQEHPGWRRTDAGLRGLPRAHAVVGVACDERITRLRRRLLRRLRRPELRDDQRADGSRRDDGHR